MYETLARARHHLCLPRKFTNLNLFAENTLNELQEQALRTGKYRNLMVGIVSINSPRNTSLKSLRQCRDWLICHAGQHAPLVLELGLIQLACFMRTHFKDRSDYSQDDILLISSFYWETVYHNFYLGACLTEVACLQLSQSVNYSGDALLNVYLAHAQNLMMSYHFRISDLTEESIEQKIFRFSAWHHQLFLFSTSSTELPSTIWLDESLYSASKSVFFSLSNPDSNKHADIIKKLRTQKDQVHEKILLLSERKQQLQQL